MCNEHGHGPGRSHGHGCGPQAFFGCMPFSGHVPMQFKGNFFQYMKKWMQGFANNILYNVEDLGESYLITVLLPGRTKDDVKVSLINGYINVKAPKPKTAKKEGNKADIEDDLHSFIRKTFIFIDVDLDIPLPLGADTDTIKSAMSNGLLKIKIGKKPAKNIDVSEENN